jgi:hypothetical protein
MLYTRLRIHEIDYKPPIGGPKTDVKAEKAENSAITNIRGRCGRCGGENDFRFQENGLTLIQLESSMRLQSFVSKSLLV